jgi:hypothetical protein
MRDELPLKPRRIKSGVINIGHSDTEGTHWVCYTKKNNHVLYFDSYGRLKPCLEFVKYMKDFEIKYNTYNHQKKNTYNCGHLCI